MKLTPAQRQAVENRGSSLLVAASAGSGKTEVLAQRCVDLIADPHKPCGIDRLLVVTFTRAAAAELRVRVADMLRRRAQTIRQTDLRDHLRRLVQQLIPPMIVQKKNTRTRRPAARHKGDDERLTGTGGKTGFCSGVALADLHILRGCYSSL